MSEAKTLHHILINTFSARRGGGKTYLINLLENIPDSAPVKITVLHSNEFDLKVNDSRVKKIFVDKVSKNLLYRYFWERFRIPKLIKELNIDIYFAPGGVSNVKKIASCKNVVMFRNVIPLVKKLRKTYSFFSYQRLRTFLLKKAILRSLDNADRAIFISQYGRKLVEARLHKTLLNCVVIPHGINDKFRHLNIKNAFNEERVLHDKYIVYVSTLERYKSQLELIETYRLLSSMSEALPKLYLVGAAEKAYFSLVQEKIEEYGLTSDVIITGELPYLSLPNVYFHAECVIFASQAENCPNILLEALAAGTAILCSSYDPMPEFAGDSVIYFDPAQPMQLASKLTHLLQNSGMRAEYKSRAIRQSELYSWPKTAELTWNALCES